MQGYCGFEEDNGTASPPRLRLCFDVGEYKENGVMHLSEGVV